MDTLKLIVPTKNNKEAALAFRKEHFDHGESVIHGSALFDKIESYDDWLKHILDSSHEETVRPGWVVASTFFVVRQSDDRIVGMIDVRHRLNEFLKNYGGHIGYSIRPAERNKGYATQALGKALNYAATIQLSKVMLACYQDNIASRKTIEKCGGILDKEFLDKEGKVIRFYWIALYNHRKM